MANNQKSAAEAKSRRTVKPSRKSLVAEYLDLHTPQEINRETLAALRRYVSERLGAVVLSDRYLIDLLEQTAIPISRELGGLSPDLRGRVHFHDFAAAEASLRDVQQEYETAREAGDRPRMQDCRRAVVRGRERLQMLLRNPKLSDVKRAEKQELLSWFRVWLENPGLFGTWIELRKRAMQPQVEQKDLDL